jgi:VanZ family protein
VTQRVLLWGPVIAYMVLIFVESSMANAPLPSNVSDKWAHMAGYGLMCVLAVRAVHGGLPAHVTSRGALIAMLITIGYGAFDEFHQSLVPGRSADPFDLLADASGGAIGLIGCWAWGILWRRSMGENADA